MSKYKQKMHKYSDPSGITAQQFLDEMRKKAELRRKDAWDIAYRFMQGKLGNEALNAGYFTQMFGFVFDEAMKNLNQIVISIPTDLIEKWKLIGAYCMKREKLASAVQPMAIAKKSPWSDGISKHLDKVLGGIA